MHSKDSIFRFFCKKLSHSLFLFVGVAMSFALTACSDDSHSPGTGNGNGNGPGPNEVWMVGQTFTPSNLQVEVGTTVKWINQSELTHTVTSGTPGNQDGIYDSGSLAPGGEYSYTFNETGTYDYFCIPHQPSMTGRVNVTEANNGY